LYFSIIAKKGYKVGVNFNRKKWSDFARTISVNEFATGKRGSEFVRANAEVSLQEDEVE
jgi:hypothetical protein